MSLIILYGQYGLHVPLTTVGMCWMWSKHGPRLACSRTDSTCTDYVGNPSNWLRHALTLSKLINWLYLVSSSPAVSLQPAMSAVYSPGFCSASEYSTIIQ